MAAKPITMNIISADARHQLAVAAYSQVSILLMSTMEYACKACGCIMSTKAKERRPLEGRPYSVLFEMASTCTEAPATAIHTVLAAAPSSVLEQLLCYYVILL